MIISRQLRIALLVSILLHLICASFVSIVFLPSGFKIRQYSSVYFLGSILRSPISIGQPPHAHKRIFTDFPSEADIQMGVSHFNESPFASLPTQKEILNPDDFIDVDALKDDSPFVADFVSAKPALEREIIFQPPFPEYPEWASSQENRIGSVIFKIFISADGLVEQLICLQASGNPEIDAALARYIGRWRFAPVFGLQGQWQTVEINPAPSEKTFLTGRGKSGF